MWLALALTGLVAVVVPVPGSAVLGVAVWTVGIVTWRWAAGVRRGVELTWDGPRRLQPDAAASGTLTVRNRSRWPVPWLEVQLRFAAGAIAPHTFRYATRLGGRRQRLLRVDFVADGRGMHEPRELSWHATDPLGLVAPWGTGTWTGPTVVVPRLAPVRRLEVPARSPLADLPLPTSLFIDQTAVAGVRAYERGDPLSSIHWPATAMTGRLMRREHERAAAREVLVCLDLAADRYQRRGRQAVAEAAIGAAASLLADTIITRRQQAGLALHAGTDAAPVVWPVRSGDRHLHTMLDALARVGLHDAVPVERVLRRVLPGLHAGTSLVVVTGVVAPTLAPAVAAAQRAALTVMVLSVGSGIEWSARTPRRVAAAPCLTIAADRALERLPL